MLKILFYTDTPIYGGAEKHMLTLAKHLNPNKYKPIFVIRKSEKTKNWQNEITQAGIKIHIIKTRSKNSPKNLPALLNLIKKNRPDLIHAHIWNPMACKYAFIAAKLTKTPIITTEHDPFIVKGIYRKCYKNLTLRQSSYVITVSKANCKLMRDIYPNKSHKILTIHNGIEKRHRKINEKEKLRIKKEVFKANANTKIVFSAGALHPRKGFKYLIEAFQKLINKPNQSKNFKLVIAGLGPKQPDLIDLIKKLKLEEKTIFLEQRSDIEQLMQASDVFVLPSLKEAFGLVIVEAMQNGLPVIATSAGGVPEIISSEKLGILVKPADTKDLANAMQKFFTNKKLREEISKNGIQHWKNFSADKMARETEKIYNKAINKNKRI